MRRTVKLSVSTLLVFGLVTPSAPSAAFSQNELVDLAIEAVNPNLKEARPVVVCAIGGTAIDTCVSNYASAKGSQQINNQLDDIDRIVRVYKLAKAGDMPGLVSTVGVTVACMTFGEMPGASLVCNEYAGKIIDAGKYALSATSAVVGPAGQAAIGWISKQAGRFGCAIGFSCPRETDPNRYDVDLGSRGTFSIAKFDLTAIWQNDYAPRVAEAIKARVEDPAHYQAMLAEVDVTAPPTWLSQQQLGWKTINGLTGQLAIEERPIGIYPVAFAPFQRELNRRFASLVNQRAADLVAPNADRFDKISTNWMQLRLPIVATELFDSPAPAISRSAALRAAINECRRNVEDPNFSLFRWATSGAAVGDSILLEGRSPAQWATLRQWCQTVYRPALGQDIQARRASFDQALTLGCTRLPNGGKGLTCPGFGPGAPVPPGSAMGRCVAAYKSAAKAYCHPAAASQTAPIRPRLQQPGAIQPKAPPPSINPVPQPSPSASPAPAPPLTPVRPKVLIPGS